MTTSPEKDSAQSSRFQVPVDDEPVTTANADDNDEDASFGEDDSHQEEAAATGPPQPSHRVQAALRERQLLARRETRVVGRLRLYLLAFLAVTGGLCAYATYRYTRAVQVDDFASRFASLAASVADRFHDAVGRKLGALDSLSVSFTSYSHQRAEDGNGESFPTVTLPDFETRAATTRILADGVYLFWLPLVRDDQRAAWEAYAYQNQGHVLQSFAKESMLRSMQDASFGVGQQAPAGDDGEEEEQNGKRRLSTQEHLGQAEVTPRWENAFETIMNLPRRLQDGAFQTYIPTIWNFQVRAMTASLSYVCFGTKRLSSGRLTFRLLFIFEYLLEPSCRALNHPTVVPSSPCGRDRPPFHSWDY